METEAIIKMLNFNVENNDESRPEVWKILIFDNHCSDIIAPLLRVGNLVEQGVTLYLSVFIHKKDIKTLKK